MSTSQHRQISSILNLVSHLHPRSILDVGMGVGSYGFLCAAAYDSPRLWRDGVKSPTLRLDAVEGFSGYVGPIQTAVYDNIMTGDFLLHLPALAPKSYELLLLIDVLEHVPEAKVASALAACRRVSKSILVSTPHEFAHQHDLDGNQLQDHLSHPTREVLREGGMQLVLPDEASLVMFAADDQAFVDYYKRRLRRTQLKSFLPPAALPILSRLRVRGGRAGS